MQTHAVLAFALGGIIFLLLGVGSIWQRNTTRLAKPLGLASLITVAWCILSISRLPDDWPRDLLLLSTEQFRNGAWIALLLQTLPDKTQKKQLLRVGCHLPWIMVLLVVNLHHYLNETNSLNLISQSTFLWLIIFEIIICLTLLEQAYRNTLPEHLDGMRFLYIALAGLFGFDLYFYVQIQLIGSVNIDIALSRGGVTAIAGLLIIFGLQRLNQSKLQFQVSRNLVLYSTSLIIIGSFLFVMALGGYYVRQLGGSWGSFAQSLIIVTASATTLIITSSKKTRAHFKVLLSKHLFRHRYDYREEWLRLIHTLTSSSIDNDINRLSLRAMSNIFETEGAALWLKYDNRLLINTANIGLPETKSSELPFESSLRDYMESTRKIIVLDEYQQFPERYPNLDLPACLKTKSIWLIIPLMLHDSLIGFIALKTPHLKRHLSWEDFDLLKTAGLQVASFLAAEQTSRSLSESKQFDAYSRLTAFIMHDLKNLIAQQSLVVKNATKHKDNPAFVEDAINTIDNSVKRMSRLLDQLKQGNEDVKQTTLCLQTVLLDATRKCHNREPRPSLHMTEEELYIKSSAEQLSMIFGHVIRNAQEATESQGFIDVSLSKKGDMAIVEVEDNGCGMNQDFIRERLFRPFDSTKSSKGMGIGAYQTREFIRQAGGDVEIFSEEDTGTTFCITLPLIQITEVLQTA